MFKCASSETHSMVSAACVAHNDRGELIHCRIACMDGIPWVTLVCTNYRCHLSDGPVSSSCDA